jgi:hypothetical protein
MPGLAAKHRFMQYYLSCGQTRWQILMLLLPDNCSWRGVLRHLAWWAEPVSGLTGIGLTGIAGHHVGIDVDRIDGIGDGDDVALAEDVEDVAAVALRADGPAPVRGAATVGLQGREGLTGVQNR